jgi:uncharacterized cupin superfamily protein
MSPSSLVRADDRGRALDVAFRHPLNPRSEVRLQALGDAAGLVRTAAWISRVAPGKESFVYHAHYTEEEFLYVLAGRGVAEVGDEVVAVGPGDFLGFPTPSIGHHLRNDGDEELVYFAGGERHRAEIVEFPRLGKRGVRVGMALALHEVAGAGSWVPGYPDLSLDAARAGITPRPSLVRAAERAAATPFRHPLNPASEAHMTSLGDPVGLERLGVWIVRVPPGKESFAHHAHLAEEELALVLAGRAIAEIDEVEVEVGPGDFLGFPAAGPSHHLRNPFDEELVYLSAGERCTVDVGEFPRHGRRVVRCGRAASLHRTDDVEAFPGRAILSLDQIRQRG